MRNKDDRYFEAPKGKLHIAVRAFLILLLVFSIVYFLWSLMQYNEAMTQKAEIEAYVNELKNDIQQLSYMGDAPLDDAFKIRIAREKLGMCFPDEIIYFYK